MRRSRPAARSRGLHWRSRPRRLLAGALARARGVEAHVIHPSSVAVSREHRRAKTDRLDTELLKRGFLGWLRGERGHCTMARIPTIAEEDAKRPNRERECLVRERTRIVNRMKGTLARLGIRNFKPILRKAAERLATLHTPEGSVLPPNVSAELQRNMARLGFVVSQTKEIEGARQKRLEQGARDRATRYGTAPGSGRRRRRRNG
jgi:transposase